LRLEIPALSVNLPVEEAKINNGVWAVSSKGVSHLNQSVNPGFPGNSIFYGHNWKSLLGTLWKIKIGNEILVADAEGQEMTFYVSEVKRVEPNDISILEDTTEPTLTLYTCAGFMDSKRLVVTATLKQSDNQ
jgi:sortase A